MKQKLLFTALSVFLLLQGTACKRDNNANSKTENVIFELERPLDEVVVQLDGEPDRLNPILSTSVFSRTIFNGIFLYLLYIDPQSLELIPQLAKSRPEVNPIDSGPYEGGSSYTFEIHDEAHWDNGSPVLAEDYVFTLKALFNPKVPAAAYRAYLPFVKDVTVDPANPRRFTVFTSEQYAMAEEAISAALPILPAYHYDPEGLMKDIPLSSLTDEKRAAELAGQEEGLQQFADLFNSSLYSREKEGVAGCGPYRLENWETGQRIVISRKEDWWGDSMGEAFPALLAYPQKIAFRPIPDPSTTITALKDGQIDAAGNIDPSRFDELKETDFVAQRFNFYSPPSLVNTFIYLNTRNPKLSDKRVRQALAHAIDVEEIISSVFYGYGKPYTSPAHPSAPYYNNALEPIGYKPEAARRLLAEAGWEDSNNNGIVDKMINGELVEMNLNYKYTAGREIGQNIALLVKESARPAGINFELEAKEFAVISDDLKQRDFEAVPWAKTISPVLWEPKQDFHSEGDNRTGFGNTETDALIDEIQRTIDDEKRKALYLELQSILYDEMPVVYILVPTGRVAIHKRFETEPTSLFPGFIPFSFELRQQQ